MRPVELYMDGLAAFRQPQTIDFTVLDELFAIVGPTGAGKTTILDGFSLALFGEMPRANQHQRKEFITLGANEAKVRLRFAVGAAEYEVARRLPRKGSQTVSFHRVEGEARIPECPDGSVTQVNRRIEEVLGYDYDAFTKAVLLPQGDFAQFLRGKPEERSKLLSRLLDCEKYEKAGAEARERAKAAEAEVELRVQLLARDWADATEERRAEVAHEAVLLRAREAVLRGVGIDVDAALRRTATLMATAATMSERRGRLSSALIELGALETDCAGLDATETATAEAVETANAALQSVRTTLHTAERLLTEAIEQDGDEEALARLQAVADGVVRAEADLATLEGRLGELATTAAEAAKAEAAAADVAAVADEAHAAASLAYDAAREDVATVREAVRVAAERAAADSTVAAARDALSEVEKKLAAAAAAAEDAKAAVAAAEIAHADLERAHRAQAIRGELAKGEPCPVCEQIVSEIPGPGPGHEALRAAAGVLHVARTRHQQDVEAERKADRRRASAETALEQAEARLERAGAVSQESPAEGALPAAEAAERDAKRALDETVTAKRGADRLLSTMRAEKAAADAALSTQQEQKASLAQRFADGRQTLIGRCGEQPVSTVVAWIAAAQTGLREKRGEVKRLREAESQAVTAAETAARTRTAHEQTARGIGERLLTVRASLAAELEAAQGAEAEDDVRGGHAHTRHIAALTSFCRMRETELGAGINETIADADAIQAAALQRVVAEGLADPDQEDGLAALEAVVVAVADAAKVTAEAAARAENQADAIARRIEQRQEHEAEIATQRQSAERYRRVANELRSDRFIKFVLEESFQELALRASEELRRVSSGRYSLRASGYDFEAIDHSNADECRSVVTLSGGESFLAALSLALAFAGSIRDLSGDPLGTRLESVFIDEGFGSLDRGVLELVADGLERVQEDRRQVGIITHVDDLAARIPSGLRVEPGPLGSSIHVRT